jgi:membrane-associated protein
MPIIRTLAPFVAGVGKMTYTRFQLFNIVGAVAWVVSFIVIGYLFGNQPMVKKNFTYVIFAIIIISFLPSVIAYLRQRMAKNSV